jgi:hypothetical protein
MCCLQVLLQVQQALGVVVVVGSPCWMMAWVAWMPC